MRTVSITGTREWTLWLVAAACAAHVAEEYSTGWLEWAPSALGIVMPAARFLAINAILVLLALLAARYGWRRPVLALVIPSATLVNALFFHILPTILQGRIAPGTYTAAALYVPFSTWAIVGAARDGVHRGAIAAAFLAGTLMMAGVVVGARLLSA